MDTYLRIDRGWNWGTVNFGINRLHKNEEEEKEVRRTNYTKSQTKPVRRGNVDMPLLFIFRFVFFSICNL